MFIKFDKVLFNKEWVASKTFQEFCDHEKHHGFTKEQMKEAYELCGGKSKKFEKKEDVKEENQEG